MPWGFSAGGQAQGQEGGLGGATGERQKRPGVREHVCCMLCVQEEHFQPVQGFPKLPLACPERVAHAVLLGICALRGLSLLPRCDPWLPPWGDLSWLFSFTITQDTVCRGSNLSTIARK